MTPFERGGFASTPVEGVDGGQAPWRRFALAERSCISAYTHFLEPKDIEQEVRGVAWVGVPFQVRPVWRPLTRCGDRKDPRRHAELVASRRDSLKRAHPRGLRGVAAHPRSPG